MIFKGQLSRQGFILPSALIKGQTGTAVLGIATPHFYMFSGHEPPGNVIIAWWQQDGKKARNSTWSITMIGYIGKFPLAHIWKSSWKL